VIAVTPQQKAARLAVLQQRSLDTVAAEVRRIVDIPIDQPLTPEEYDAVSYYYVRPDEYARGFRLLPRQAEALVAYNETGGVFGPIAVGAGKTLTSLLIADDCYRAVLEANYKAKGDAPVEKQIPRILLIVPPQVLSQLRNKDIAYARKHTRFSTDVHFVAGVSKKRRLLIARSNRRGLYVVTYSILSAEGADDLLDGINPSCIICDEAHHVSGNSSSARAKRFRRFVDHNAPQVIALSGTLTSKSPMDYHYLAKAALGRNNFLPNALQLAQAWSMLIDTNAAVSQDTGFVPQAGPIMPLVDWARKNFPGEEITKDVVGFRRAYSNRLYSTPGVVASREGGYGGSLLIENMGMPPDEIARTEGYERMKALVDDLVSRQVAPNGDELEHAMHVWKWRYEIEGAGFYNELYWPEPEVLSRRARLSLRDAEVVIERSKHCHELQQEYAVELRDFFSDGHRRGMDTPKLVGIEMYRNGAANVPASLYRAWKTWKDSDFEGRIDRDSKAVRVCPFKINHCVASMKDITKEARGRGVIVWYYHQEVGNWVTDELKKAGYDAVNCMAGDKWNDYLVDSAALSGKILCCSISAHGTGKNLQHGFDTSYYLQWPRSAQTAAQSIGRTHRNGQVSDEVRAITCHCSEFDRVTFAATLNDSAYVSQTLGKQNLMYATYNPVPQRVPYAVLREWGTQAREISGEAQELLDGVLEG